MGGRGGVGRDHPALAATRGWMEAQVKAEGALLPLVALGTSASERGDMETMLNVAAVLSGFCRGLLRSAIVDAGGVNTLVGLVASAVKPEAVWPSDINDGRSNDTHHTSPLSLMAAFAGTTGNGADVPPTRPDTAAPVADHEHHPADLIQLHVASALSCLANHGPRTQRLLVECGAVQSLAALLNSESEQVALIACRALAALADSSSHHRSIASSGAVPSLIHMFHSPVKETSLRALYTIAQLANTEPMIAGGGGSPKDTAAGMAVGKGAGGAVSELKINESSGGSPQSPSSRKAGARARRRQRRSVQAIEVRRALLDDYGALPALLRVLKRVVGTVEGRTKNMEMLHQTGTVCVRGNSERLRGWERWVSQPIQPIHIPW